ncbi:MFS transporter [Sphaerisporangium sp. NPDC088356]|uniref:MFS transporter n=1 Tax=Sphaerisporangium sp. NPDC088356 TaxID=3154871 RepID=UPI0034414B78
MSDPARRPASNDTPTSATPASAAPREPAGGTSPSLDARGDLQVGIAQAALGFCVTSLGATLVMLARDLRVPVGSIAWLASAFGAGLLVAAAAGPVLLRRGPRPTLRAGALVLAAGAALLALAPSPGLAVAGALLLGLGGAGLVLVTPALLDGPGVAARLTRVNAASSTAGVLAPLALGLLDSLGPSGRLVLLVAVPPLLVAAAVTIPGTAPGPRAPASVPSTSEAPGVPTSRREVTAPRREVARRWTRVMLAVSVEFCFAVWAVARLQETGVTPGEAAGLGSTFAIGMALGRIAAPRLIQRVRVVPLCAVAIAAGTLLVVASNGPVSVAAGLVIAGLGVAPLYPVTLADLVATPDLRGAHSASLGALASGTAILLAPSALAALGQVADLRLAFLVTIPLLVALTAMNPRKAT